MRVLRSQIFRQIVQRGRGKAVALQGRIVQDGEKDASKRAAKALAVNCVVLPQLTEWSDTRDVLSIISDRFRHG